ncbi:unnamed protein product [Hermetia illucens]|uniref:G-protein coupled receptors family 1 profile domain-containing protein n=1 Tax=Hermetia illucens TaxID=343691 RepID=A0A7R8UNH9_HERIL|nr:pyrokinin-1 receptor-like isoform X2 [Hermetia illucens]CAD7084087.1 unnamed protein product [Hermetia illucens]
MNISEVLDELCQLVNQSSETASWDELLQNYSTELNISHLLNTSCMTLTDDLVKESSRDAIPILATITICYIFIFIAGVLGNLITCTVISRNKFMHTATNYYLFNLAISDLLLLLSGMPYEIYDIWFPSSFPFTDPICILKGLLSETSANATVLTITAFTVERYIAICHPFRQHTMSKLSRVVKFILLIWMSAFILAIPQSMQFGVRNSENGNLCTVTKSIYMAHAFEVSGFLFFIGPMTAICVLYVLIGIKLNKSKYLQEVKRKPSEPNRNVSGQTRVIRMLVAVAVAFFLCWAPFHAQRLVAVYGSKSVTSHSDLFYKVYKVLTYISGVLYYLSTCINPLLYNIMSYKFRDAFKLTLARQFGLGSKYQVKNHNYSALSRQNGSVRLTTTTDSTRAKPHRLRCVSVSSQSTLMTSLSKNDMFAGNPLNRGDLQIISSDEQGTSSESQQEMPAIRRQSSILREGSMKMDVFPRTHGGANGINRLNYGGKGSFSRNGSNLSNGHQNGQSCYTVQSGQNGNHINGKSSPNPPISRPITIESLSEKLRKGTRKVLSLRPNATIASKQESNSQLEKGALSNQGGYVTRQGEPAWDSSPTAEYIHRVL